MGCKFAELLGMENRGLDTGQCLQGMTHGYKGAELSSEKTAAE
jgi:hypothetical protein